MDFESGSGKATNNTAEYDGLLAGLRAAAGLGIKRVVVRGDSQLIVRQVTKEYNASPQMKAYLDEVRKLERRFDGIQMEHIPRGENLVADELSKLAAERGPVPPGIFVERLTRPSAEPKVVPGALATPTLGAPRTDATSGTSASRDTTLAKPGEEPTPGNDDVMVTERVAPSWATDMMRFMRDRVLPEDDAEAERVARQAKMYTLIDGDIYRRPECGVKLLCVSREEGQALLMDMHEGTCSSHVASRALAGKVFRQGFYWPTALMDADSTGTIGHDDSRSGTLLPLSAPCAACPLELFCRPLSSPRAIEWAQLQVIHLIQP